MNSLKSPKLPTTVVVLFLIFMYLLGIDFGFKKKIKKKFLVITNGVQILMIVLMLAILFSPLLTATLDNIHYFFYAINYVVYCVIAYTAKYNVCDLMIDIHSIIDGKKVSVSNKFTTIIYAYLFIIFLIKFAVCNLGCVMDMKHCNSLTTPSYIYCIPAIAMESLTIIQILISYYMYLSVEYIKKSLNKVDIKILQANYMHIGNCWDKIKPLYAKMVSQCFPSFVCFRILINHFTIQNAGKNVSNAMYIITLLYK